MRSESSKRIVLILIAFGLGIAAGAAGYKNISRWVAKYKARQAAIAPPYDRERELLRDAFTDKLLSGEKFVYSPCASAQDVANCLTRQFRTFAATFPTAYQRFQLRDIPADGQPDRLVVPYTLDAASPDIQNAWAYRLPASAGAADTAILIIPGSGLNESSKIAYGDTDDYHGDIAALARTCGEVFVLVKPNEDFLAIHDGTRKLDYIFITNHLLNRGLSYSAQYLCDALAVTKYLQTRYRRVYVVGLSQGGTAALYVALQAQPAGAIVASGYSVTSEVVDPAGPNQIIVPGIAALYDPPSIRRRIGELTTRFLFSYGTGEPGSYRVEAVEGPTAKFMEGLDNVTFVVHPGGHAFPREAVREFLSGTSPAASQPATGKQE